MFIELTDREAAIVAEALRVNANLSRRRFAEWAAKELGKVDEEKLQRRLTGATDYHRIVDVVLSKLGSQAKGTNNVHNPEAAPQASALVAAAAAEV